MDQGIMVAKDDGSASFRKAIQHQQEKWWLPVPRAPHGGLLEDTRKQLNHKRECASQILKAAMSIHSITLAEMKFLNHIWMLFQRTALKRIIAEATDGSALITTAQGKFFSNGIDLAWAISDPSHVPSMDSKLKSLVFDLFSLPMPTIAAVTGHASAGGFILAMCHDYVLMRKDRGFLYMSELDVGLKIPAWCVALVKSKVRSPAASRDVLLRGAKLTADVAIELGVVDSAHVGAAKTVEEAVKLGEELVGRKWDGKVYAHSRRLLFSDVMVTLTSEAVSRL